MRTLPLSSIVAPLPRAVRDLAAETGKQVELVVLGAETELDRAILEGLTEPLVHILRNAIAHGLQRVEAGAQGRHKIQRGYLPCHTYSAHWIVHHGLRRAVANFVRDEQAGIEAEMAALAEESPFRKAED